MKLNNNSQNNQSIKCLGVTFESNEARRTYFLEKLREILQTSDLKNISGFPHATEEAILALSDPPYYTACPNPWLADILKEWEAMQKKPHKKCQEPFASDVKEGKNDPIYNAHSYHTKVPHKAITRYILHYTNPGDVVFDSFCGTGMTGVAAQLCGDKRAIEALGYRVQPDGTIETQEYDENGKSVWKAFSKLGARQAILNDLSPAAMFITYNYNTPVDMIAFSQAAQQILRALETECGWMYQTLHNEIKEEQVDELKSVILGEMDCPRGITLGRINYTVWSDVFVCPECANNIVFWEAAIDKEARKVHKQFSCSHCDASLTKRVLERAWITRFDSAIGETIQQAKQVPVLINYSVGKTRYQKTPDELDLALLEKIEEMEIPYWFPMVRMREGGESRRNDRLGITHLHHFYTKRNLWVLSAMHFHITQYTTDRRFLNYFKVWFTSSHSRLHKMNRYAAQHNRHVGPLANTLYLSSTPAEISPLSFIGSKIKDNCLNLGEKQISCLATGSANQINLPDNSVDYIFLDPPFGSNIMYSELNFLWEGWLQVFTNNQPEAIVNKTKSLNDYYMLMIASFKEAFRLLKPGRWMTVEFSNTQASIWNTIQTSLQKAGFVISSVDFLNKGRGGLHAITGTTAVKQDLIISAYKPNGGLEKRFKKVASSEEGVWEFVRSHLKYLPISKIKDGKLAFITEREPRILYDRTLAYFIGHGYPVPLSSQQFQAGLQVYFKERDGMIFRLDQIESYEQKRKIAKTPPQMNLFISDERSAIDWLYSFLKKRPSTRQEIHPELTKLIGAGWKKYETMVELDVLLEFNFLKYDGKGTVPSQIHRYLSNQYKACRHLEKNDLVLQEYATERWYVPDPSKAQDLEKIREARLLREFKQYCQSNQKHLRTFRLEAMRTGFKQAWAQQDYHTIIDMAKKMPERALYEDEKLLQLYDLAVVRLEGVS